jgi:hypothetical protein
MASTQQLDERLRVNAIDRTRSSVELEAVIADVQAVRSPSFGVATRLLRRYMDMVGAELAAKWTDERYVRPLDDGDLI